MEKYKYAYAGISALMRMGVTLWDDPALVNRFKIYLKQDIRPAKAKTNCGFSILNYPRGSVISIDGHNVCCPELAFVQSANRVRMQQLILLGTELCSGHRAITTVEKITEYVSRVPYLKGKRKALLALNYVIPNSGSVAETEMVMNLCLPAKFGGYGLPEPILNKRIDIANDLKLLAGKEFYVGDMVWEKYMLITEYDSKQEHENAGSAKLHQDRVRSEILDMMGWRVFSCSDVELRDRAEMQKRANMIAKALHVRNFNNVAKSIIYFDRRSPK